MIPFRDELARAVAVAGRAVRKARRTAVERTRRRPPPFHELLAAHARDIRGRVLVVGDVAAVTRHLGAASSVEVVDVDPSRDGTTFVADVVDDGVVAPASFDCAIVEADLGERLDAALARIWDGLVGGGVLLVDRRRAVKPA